MKRILTLGISLLIASLTTATAQQKAESKETKIARALSAAPPNIAKAAMVADRDEKGNDTVLREGTNGVT